MIKKDLSEADIPFVFSSNGDGFYFHDKTATDSETEKELSLEDRCKGNS